MRGSRNYGGDRLRGRRGGDGAAEIFSPCRYITERKEGRPWD
jgi:hypothetical protein